MSHVTLTVELEDEHLDEESLQETTRLVCDEVAGIAGVEDTNLIPVTAADPNAKDIGGFLVNVFKAVVTSDVVVSVVGAVAELNAGRKVTIEIERTAGESSKKISVKVGSPKDLEQVVPQIQQLLDA